MKMLDSLGVILGGGLITSIVIIGLYKLVEWLTKR